MKLKKKFDFTSKHSNWKQLFEYYYWKSIVDE